MARFFYAAHNSRANLSEGNRGFLNTWEVSRFPSRAKRDAFVDQMSNMLAEPCSRERAIRIYADNFRCVGKPVPRGGLLADPDGFWNESACF
jgi:hypothetical protein